METLIGEGMFTIGKKIGSGAFGTVYEGRNWIALMLNRLVERRK